MTHKPAGPVRVSAFAGGCVSPAEVIAEALGRHYAVSFGECLCGWQTTRTKIGESWRPEFDEHQASVIAALPDIAIVPRRNGRILNQGHDGECVCDHTKPAAAAEEDQ